MKASRTEVNFLIQMDNGQIQMDNLYMQVSVVAFFYSGLHRLGF